MAQKKRKRKPARRKSKPEPYPGWMWMLFGLAIGLSVAFAVYMKDQRKQEDPEPVAQAPASMSAPLQPEPAPVATPEPPPEDVEVEDSEPRFSFYNMLPSFEVIIPEEEPDVSLDDEVKVVEQPGTYVLQAGSFTDAADADRRRAELALLGVESRVQRIAIDERTYHRVRIGPTSDLDELNRIRGTLRAAQIDVLRIRIGD
jgi:cell division septation protein DedD